MSKNKTLRNKYRSIPCIICGDLPSDATHIKSYATTLEDKEENLVPLCRLHHSEQHQIGILTFINKYPNYKEYIHKLGFKVINRKLLLNKSLE